MRRRRDAFGLTQGELAERAGVSRAVVGAWEQGRHMPAADTAIRLARTLDMTVERLFGPPGDARTDGAVAVLGGALRPGGLVRAARVGERLVAHGLDGTAALTGDGATADGTVVGPLVGEHPGAAPADGTVDASALADVRLFAGATTTGAVVAGCDPLLVLADGLLARAGAARLLGVPATTAQAIAALEVGRCHAALVHGPAAGLASTAPTGTRRWHVARWRAGVATHPALARPSLEVLLAGGTPFLQRDRGAACQQAVDRAARRLGVTRPRESDPPRRSAGHLDAARAALEQRGAAVTIEPVALAVGLDFAALELHDVELWVPADHAAHPGLVALLDLLVTTRLRERIAALPAYDLTDAGAAR